MSGTAAVCSVHTGSLSFKAGTDYTTIHRVRVHDESHQSVLADRLATPHVCLPSLIAQCRHDIIRGHRDRAGVRWLPGRRAKGSLDLGDSSRSAVCVCDTSRLLLGKEEQKDGGHSVCHVEGNMGPSVLHTELEGRM